ncbi:MAG: DUF1800 domain-containing protein [Chloroherpetonaceae bacterium]|nr:DUF1800 domain-containing protein [Chloroherpetonaceae bacterium]
MHTKKVISRLALLVLSAVTLCCTALPTVSERSSSGALSVSPYYRTTLKLPYREAGLSDREAAAHLLDRFAFGARPGEVDAVVQMGVEKWLEQQLEAKQKSTKLDEKLAQFPALAMSNAEILNTYPNPGLLLAQAYREGLISQRDTANRAELRRKILGLYRKEGVRPQRELLDILRTQKILRAVYSENQLEEVLTDFWFNHFNVSITDNRARAFVLSYERDAIRPNALGKFRTLLGATAKHPAMLLYLDNAQSTAAEGASTTLSQQMRQSPLFAHRRQRAMVERKAEMKAMQDKLPDAVQRRFPKRGINENYARELMELHTLGVEGGYTQKDVVEVARAFTGWTVAPRGKRAEPFHTRIEQAKALGFLEEGDFLFRPDMHDAGEKVILGTVFPAGGGKEEGERVLDILASHPSTARFISTKLARRFVSDSPPKSLIEKLTKAFLETDGDIRAMVRTMAESPEFWSKEARHAKIKSPFELTVSALRAIGAEVEHTRDLARWIERQGQPLYACQAPTGYPDSAAAWVNAGALLNRMNFGLQLALGRIQGISFDLLALNGYHEPESLEDALRAYAARLLPERDHSETIRRLLPLLQQPDFAEQLSKVVPNMPMPRFERNGMKWRDETVVQDWISEETDESQIAPAESGENRPTASAVAKVVGLILGSPEFQRR